MLRILIFCLSLCSVGIVVGQRPIIYMPEDSMYLIPKERAEILDKKARQYHALLIVVDSLNLERDKMLQDQSNLRKQNKELTEQLNTPSPYDRVGKFVVGSIIRIGIGLISKD